MFLCDSCRERVAGNPYAVNAGKLRQEYLCKPCAEARCNQLAAGTKPRLAPRPKTGENT